MLSVQPDTKPKGCAGCNRKIKDRYLLKALDKYWHEDCLKCACCDCRLGECIFACLFYFLTASVCS
uniref:LIM domain only protein 3 n=1 Tax=Chinchilla lanigera TaxID=34839 RepID=A0A8C2YSQ8_CHILA